MIEQSFLTINIADEADDQQARCEGNLPSPYSQPVNPTVDNIFAPLQWPAPNEHVAIQAAIAKKRGNGHA